MTMFDDTHSHKNQAVYILSAITVVGAALRFYGLDIQSLWYDEIASWNQSRATSITELFNTMRDNVHPPGWVVIIHLSRSLIGDSEVALRLPSAIAGVASIPLIYALGKKLFSYQVGLIAAALMSIFWAPIYYSQESRAYAILILLSIATIYYLTKLTSEIETENTQISTVIIYILLCTACSYIHYSGLLLIVLQGIWAAVSFRQSAKALTILIAIYVVQILLYLPWLFELLKDIDRQEFWVNEISNPGQVLNFFFFKGSSSDALVSVLLLSIVALMILIALIGAMSKSYKAKVRITKSNTVLLLMLFSVPYIAFYIKSLISSPILIPRYILVSLPAAYLLVAIGINRLFQNQTKALNSIIVLIVSVGIWNLVFNLDYYNKKSKTDFRALVNEINSAPRNIKSNSDVIVYRGGLAFDYYFDKTLSENTINHRINITTPLGQPISTFEETRLKNHINETQASYIWLLSGTKLFPESIKTELLKSSTLITEKQFYDSKAWLFKKQI